MTIVKRHNGSDERAVIVKDDYTGQPLSVEIKRNDQVLFVIPFKCVKNEETVKQMIDDKIFKFTTLN